MPLPVNTYITIIRYLNLPITDETKIKNLLATAAAKPEVEAEITEILQQLTAADAQKVEGAQTGRLSMTRADLVEWDVNARNQGINAAINVLQQRLANVLGLDYSSEKVIGCGTTSVSSQTIF